MPSLTQIARPGFSSFTVGQALFRLFFLILASPSVLAFLASPQPPPPPRRGPCSRLLIVSSGNTHKVGNSPAWLKCGSGARLSTPGGTRYPQGRWRDSLQRCGASPAGTCWAAAPQLLWNGSCVLPPPLPLAVRLQRTYLTSAEYLCSSYLFYYFYYLYL